MSQPFFEYGRNRLDALARPGLLCAFDFDGTLAPIVKEPDRVSVPAAVLRRLEQLAACTPQAIITGRSVADLSRRLPFAPHYVIGNHGLEGLPGNEQEAAQWTAQCVAWESALAQARPRLPGMLIENKGASLSVHYRMCADRDAAAARLAGLIAEVAPHAHVIGGKCVFNLMPTADVNKGSALLRLLEASGAHAALYVGDDVTDEDVFRLRRADVLTVRIERDPASSAEFFLHHRLDLVRLLDELIERLRTPRQHAFG